ncbi:hypothetical protein [Fibrella aquatilis]|uniref:Lipocalin-like domain-containing protein n=1 Tax=Fibrella aquatilis TaxID=2817059 RepID=A0A939G8P5_9BACT|nr:hypothetical protein [Fibrella aquatilis]MBO0931848.1 hypothetical protein [Fibrella aquatilis]
MKRIALFLLLLAGVALSCKKSGGTDNVTPVDPRDRMVGSYTVGGQISITSGSRTLTPTSFSGTVGVTKSTQPTELYLDFDLQSGKERLTASLKDSSFTVLDKKTEPIILNGTSFVGQYTATGQFLREGKDQKFTFVSVSQDVDLKKLTAITGTKK